MTILVAVKKNGRVGWGPDRITTFGSEYSTDLVNASKIIKLKHAYLATSGYTLLDNVIEHLYEHNHKMMESNFENRAQVFQFFLELYSEMKKTYTLVDTGKETYAGIYNVFLLVTPTSIFGISNNLSVHEYDKFAAKGAGSDYSQGTLYALYELMDDGRELCRIALEAACHFSIYCKEPIDIIEVRSKDFGDLVPGGYKGTGKYLETIPSKIGMANFDLVQKKGLISKIKAQGVPTNGDHKSKESKKSAVTSSRAKTSKPATAKQQPSGKGGKAKPGGKSK
jgi:ATP-dependent protease HslVU (ClpYQ), peptidase subunit